MSTGFHDRRRKVSENMAVQSLPFQLIDIAPPIALSGYNLERFILTHVPLTKFDDDWVKRTPPFDVKLNVG